ncbi:MAG: cupredoxin domain-containing protein [Planctomycetota bacterium]
MGLVGALIVRPRRYHPVIRKGAYNHPDARYDYEYLFLLTEMDPVIHELAQCGKWDQIDLTNYWPVLWFINGRNAPDTMLPSNTPLLPTQPYNCMPRMHPGDRILLRFLGGGRDLHPFHPHGNNFLQIARDGRLLSSAPGAGADLAVSNFTLAVAPGQTADAIFEWTGAQLGWDIYGHDVNDPLQPNEYAPDHGKPFPVTLPDAKNLTFGASYSGSPFLGLQGDLPPGQGGFNVNAGYFYMWHSHNEKEMVNYDIFPGGMMTMLIVEPHGVTIE